MDVLGWKVWYEDYSSYTSLDTFWEDLPYDGMQAVKIFYVDEYLPGKHYTKTLDGKDWYYMAPDGTIEGTPSIGWDGWVDPPCSCTVDDKLLKRGTAVTDEVFQSLTKIVREDQSWR